ncbi:MAG: serine hydrolase, partial [Clostridium sp.]|nr:serine hydrolase [Clostridium sp.]
MKRRFAYKTLTSVCLSIALALGPASFAYASTPVITPLEESSVANLGSGENSGPGGTAGQTGNGPVSGGGQADQSGPAGSAPGQNSAPDQGETQGQGTTPGGAAGSNSPGGSSNPSAPAADSEQTAVVEEPSIAAEGAALLNASTGKLLFSKNGDTKYYPASITKLMTALLVAENCNLDDTVTFSATATTNLEAGAVSLNLVEGDKLTVRQCLYALLLKSANEVGNALAEHVAGSNAKFA